MDIETRWRLIFGAEDKTSSEEIVLEQEEAELDSILGSVYDKESKGFGRSSKKIKSWLEKIRFHFNTETVKILQKDALERLGAKEMLLEPELLEQIEPDIQMVSTILSLQHLLPDKIKSVARSFVQQMVQKIERKLRLKTIHAVQKANYHLSKKINPSSSHHIDWNKTIRRNLKNYQASIHQIIPDQWYGYQKTNQLKEIFLLVDTSESMIESAIHASIIGSILASLKTIKTHIIYFSDTVVDFTDKYRDPVDLLFSIPFGGGTDISSALLYLQQKIHKPNESYVFLLSDLDEYGDKNRMMSSVQLLIEKKVHFHCILSLHESGKANYHKKNADECAALGAICYACSPDEFPTILGNELTEKNK